MSGKNPRFDVAVAGGGPAGLVSAALMAGGGLNVAVLAPRVAPDGRTVALMQPSIRLLRHLGLWPAALQGDGHPLRRLTLVDDTGGYVTAPRVTFSAEELGHEAFGWNISLAALISALSRACEARGATMLQVRASRATLAEEAATLSLDDGTRLECAMLVAADGRSSTLRDAARIDCLQWSYDQAAIATSFAHSVPHDDTSTEYLGPNGPLTTVPMPGLRSSLVWMEHPRRIAALMALPEEDFAAELQAAMHGELGLTSAVQDRSAFPMEGLIAADFGCRRMLLVGEAAHLLPPLGAQGLNLSLGDAATAAELILDAFAQGADLGSDTLVSRYASLRRPDVMTRQALIHGLNRSLLAGFLPADLGRTAGIALASRVPALRAFIMRQGLEPSFHLPAAMRELDDRPSVVLR